MLFKIYKVSIFWFSYPGIEVLIFTTIFFSGGRRGDAGGHWRVWSVGRLARCWQFWLLWRGSASNIGPRVASARFFALGGFWHELYFFSSKKVLVLGNRYWPILGAHHPRGAGTLWHQIGRGQSGAQAGERGAPPKGTARRGDGRGERRKTAHLGQKVNQMLVVCDSWLHLCWEFYIILVLMIQ